jgi:hypothetical protein
LSDPGHAAAGLEGAILGDFNVAAADWLSHFDGKGSIDFQINIAPTAEGRSESAPASLVAAGFDHGIPVYEPGTLDELATGVDVNGAAPDAVITIDPSYLRQGVWVDPSPQRPASPVPSDKVDLTSIFRHELGHDLGIISATPGNGPSPGWETTFDAHTAATDGGVFFVGANARAAYGGNVPVTTLPTAEAHSHLGNSLNEAAGQDVMNGIAFYMGTRYQVSALDLAILEDIGAPVVQPSVAAAGARHGVSLAAAHAPQAVADAEKDGRTGAHWTGDDHHLARVATDLHADYHHYWG